MIAHVLLSLTGYSFQDAQTSLTFDWRKPELVPSSLIPWINPETILHDVGPYALVVVCFIIFAETALLVGFLLPGDTLLIATGLFAFHPGIGVDIWWAAIAIGVSAFLGGEVGYLIGHKLGPSIFEKKDSGLFSRKNVERTNAFFERFGGMAVILARFVPIVRTFTPVAAGVGHMNYKRYSLYNFIGAVVWDVGLTFAGYLVSYIPPVADFVRQYIDIALLAAVSISVLPAIYHYIQTARAAKRARREGVPPLTDEEAVIDQAFFDNDKSNDPPRPRKKA